MSQPWQAGNQRLHEIYRDIQRQRDEHLAQILRVLEPKVLADAEIAEVVKTLKRWVSDANPPTEPPRDADAAEEDPCADHADHQARR